MGSLAPLQSNQVSRVRRLAADPLLHFMAIGLVLLALYALVAPPQSADSGLTIELTEDDLRQIQVAWLVKWKRPPTSAEMRTLVDQKVREEVLYREAIAMGLEQNDTIVKRRLAQKLEFLTEDIAAIRDPDAGELEAWFVGNAERFETPGRVTFRHIYFSPDKRGDSANADALSALQQLQGAANSDVTGVGDPFSDRYYYADRTSDDLAGFFGLKFADALEGLPTGKWIGPVESGLGWHLVWIDAIAPGRIPSFAEVDRDAVKAAWIDVQRAESKRLVYQAMRSKYDVVMPGGEPE